MTYRCFTRTWWRENPNYPNGLEPSPGKKRTKATVKTEEEAQTFCQDWNRKHAPGRLSLKCEYEEL